MSVQLFSKRRNDCLLSRVSPPSGGQDTRGEGDRGRVLWCLGELCNDWCYDKKIAGENELTCGLKIFFLFLITDDCFGVG